MSDSVLILGVVVFAVLTVFAVYYFVQGANWLIARVKHDIKVEMGLDERSITIKVDAASLSDTVGIIGGLVSGILLLGEASLWMTVAVFTALFFLTGRLVIRHKIREIEQLGQVA